MSDAVVRRDLLWFAALGGVVTWAARFTAAYPLVGVACRTGSRWPLYLLTGVALALILASTGTALAYTIRLARRPRSRTTERQRLMAQVGLGLGALSLLLTIAESSAILVDDPCTDFRYSVAARPLTRAAHATSVTLRLGTALAGGASPTRGAGHAAWTPDPLLVVALAGGGLARFRRSRVPSRSSSPGPSAGDTWDDVYARRAVDPTLPSQLEDQQLGGVPTRAAGALAILAGARALGSVCLSLSAVVLVLPACRDETPRSVESGGARGPGERAALDFELHVSPPEPAVGELFEVVTTVRDRRSGQLVRGASVRVDASMPQHGHGMVTRPEHVELGDGRYLTRGMKLHMPGAWRLRVDAKQGTRSDRFDAAIAAAPKTKP